jgi:hypothetical protein
MRELFKVVQREFRHHVPGDTPAEIATSARTPSIDVQPTLSMRSGFPARIRASPAQSLRWIVTPRLRVT